MQEVKFCSKCNENRDVKDFNRNKVKKDGLQTYCKFCQSKVDKLFYRNNQNRQLGAKERRANHKKQVREFIYRWYLEHPCVHCGETDPVVLTCDHLGDKNFCIGISVTRGYSLERIKSEMNKCQVLCANCHLRKTAKDFEWYKDIISAC